MTGAQFEILVDGKPQSYSDFKEVAIASAELIKSHNPLSEVAVRDMKTGEMTPVSYKWRSRCARPPRFRGRKGTRIRRVYLPMRAQEVEAIPGLPLCKPRRGAASSAPDLGRR